MKKIYLYVKVLLLISFASFASYHMVGYNRAHQSHQMSETAFERVNRTGVIRCGYVTAAPFLLKDLNTGEFSGIAYDFMNAIARELDIRLEWTEEVGWGNFQAGLNGNKYDVMCVPVYQSGARAKVALLSKPLYYNALYAVARADDDRFDGGIETINKPEVRVAVIDGDVARVVTFMKFSAAQQVTSPQLSDDSFFFLSVASKKADIGFGNIDGLQRYNANAAVKLKLAMNGTPVRYFANSLAVRLGDIELKNALDATIDAINTDGTAEQIVKKYGTGFRGIIHGYAVKADAE